MSLSSSEMLPNDINDLPPARQRHIRRQPRAASQAERQLLLESLVSLTDPTLNFLLLSLIGAVTLALSLYFNAPTLLILSLALLPFLRPIFGLALLPAQIQIKKGLIGLASLSIILGLIFAGGVLSGWMQKSIIPDQLGLFHFGYLYWLDLIVLCAASFFAAFYLLRRGRTPRLIAMLLSYEILVPLAAAGFALPIGAAELWPHALLISLIHLGLAVLTAFFTFALFGFSPKRSLSWLMIALLLVLTIACALLSQNFTRMYYSPIQTEAPTTGAKTFSPPTPTARTRQSSTATSILITKTPTQKPSQTSTPASTTMTTPTLTPTYTSTSYWGIIDASTGVVIRESPAPDALVIDYADNGDEIEILDDFTSQDGVRWYQVLTDSGKSGWLLAALVAFRTPVP